MPGSPQSVTPFELAVLQVLWESPDVAIRQISESLYGSTAAAQYYTVQKLLERLERKGLVVRDRSSRTHVYRAAIDRNEFMGVRLQELADTVCEGSLTPLLTGLLHVRSLSSQDINVLRQLVVDLEARSRKPPASKPRK